MRPAHRAFTILELLVVLAIISVLAGVLFPVFSSARESSKRTTCMSNFREVSLSTHLYMNDYEDNFMPVNHEHGAVATSRNDRTWVQLVLPYVRNFGMFYCPSDTSDRPRPEATFDEDLVPGDTDTQYYTASQRVNMGYNYQYLAPIIRQGGEWSTSPRSSTSLASPSNTILFADSVWARRADGTPTGGGSWLVVPPCRYSRSATGAVLDSFTGALRGGEVYTNAIGWRLEDDGSPLIYGGAWPWHTGRVNISYVDGSARSQTIGELSAGCDLKDHWKGFINDTNVYAWDTL